MTTTLRATARFEGVGLHSGRPARLSILPAAPGHRIRLRRLDGPRAPIAVRWDAVTPAPLCTRLLAEGVEVSTVEHVMAALAGAGVDDALLEIDGPEIPILDGSAAPFLSGLMAVGLRETGGAAWAIEILDRVEVRDGEALARLDPAGARGRGRLTIDFTIDFPDAAIGRQRRRLTLVPGAFARELAGARTFCRGSEVEALRARGLARGGTLANAVVIDGADVLNPEGLRWPDEPVRHKMLDALGDLALAGAPIHGCYTGVCAGHRLTNALLRALHAAPDAWRWVERAAPARRAPAIEAAPVSAWPLAV